jgi:branched-chain amino acid transport system ATP-binding protein
MPESLLRTENLYKSFGGVVATDHVQLSVHPGEAHAIIGPNGAGKTTLLAQLSGQLSPSAGHIYFDRREITHLPVHERVGLGIARSFQITSVLPSFSVAENVQVALRPRFGHSFVFFRNAGHDTRLERDAQDLLTEVGLADRAKMMAGALAHGEQRQLELAMALASEPRLLLLDEPMAGVGHDDAEKMIALLLRIKQERSLLLIEHDMDAVFRIADRITVLVGGKVIASDTPDNIRRDPAVRRAYLGDEADTP